MAYTQEPGRGNSNPIMKLSDKLKGDSGLKLLGDLDKDGKLNKYEAKRQAAIDSNSPASMYGAPIEMKANNGPMPQSGLNYGTPLYHEKGPEGHVHDANNPQVEITVGKRKVDRKKRKETASQMAEAVLSGENVEAYTKSGRGKLEVFKEGNVINTRGRKGGTYGKGTGRSTADVSELNEKKLARQINKQLRRTGSVSVKDGVVEGGVTITKPMTEVQKKKKAAIDKRRAENQAKKAEKQKQIAAARARAQANRQARITSQEQAKSKRIADLKAKQEQRKTEKS